MTKIKELELMNNTMINYLKKVGQNASRNEIISKILKDKACFFKIEKADAFIILQDIGIKETELETVYNDLISRKEYYELQNQGIINDADDDIKIKYDKYNASDIFSST